MSTSAMIDHLGSFAEVEPVLRQWRLSDLERGYRNLCHLANTLDENTLLSLFAHLGKSLPRCPDPDRSLNNLERLLATSEGRSQLPALLEPRSKLLENLLQLFSNSQFFCDVLVSNPEDLEMVRIPLRNSPNRAELLEQLEQAVDSVHDDNALLKCFRRFRNRQMIRIGTNDLIRERPIEEITRDISRVADVSLEVALRVACRNMSNRFGDPRNEAGEPARFVILAFGKHGGKELNYSSDIDLMVIYDEEGETAGQRLHPMANEDFFARVTSEVVRLLSSHTDYGQAYRIDLRLRPEGNRGPLARSLNSALSYYDTLGRTWERQALIKLRPVAGDLQLGEEFIRSVEPFIYRKYLSYAEINEIKALKRRIEHKTRPKESNANEVKTGFGGIRDVEFTIQFLQLLNGGDLPTVRQRNTLKAMRALEEVGCLTHQEYIILDNTYRFLRKIEHRLQLISNLQTHRMSADERELQCLALSMGYKDLPGNASEELPSNGAKTAAMVFLEDYREKTELNRKILDHLLHESFESSEADAQPETDLILDPDPDKETVEQVLGKYPFRDVQLAYNNLMALATESVPFLSTRRCRHFLASIAPLLLRTISETPDPDMALVNLEKVTASLGGKAVLWELFSFSTPALTLYVDLCAWSQLLSDILINNPGMIDELLDSLILNQPRTLDELKEELSDLCRKADDPDVILHSFQDKELLRIGVRDILDKDTLQETTAALSDVAETILCQITDLQLPEMIHRFGVPYLADGPRKGEPARFVLLGLGKLGGREMSYHSDLDLIMIYEGEGRTGPPAGATRFDSFEEVEHLHFFTELAQRIIKAASYLGPNGRLYHVDMRLRPTGKSGSLAISLAEFHRYYTSGAGQLWERQALTRARLVYGEEEFGKQVLEAVRQAVYEQVWRPEMAEEIYKMRRRVQASGKQRDLKRGYGGIIDIEFLVQLFRLKYGQSNPSLHATNTWEALHAIHEAKLLEDNDFQVLSTSLDFLRQVESRLRVVHNRSLDELPEKQEDIDKLARRLGFESSEEESPGTQFLEALDQHLKGTRSVFERILEKEKSNG